MTCDDGALPAEGPPQVAGMTDPRPDRVLACPKPDRLAQVAGFVQQYLEGGPRADEFGFDPDFNASVLMPIARLLYRNWFRVRMRGLEHVPDSGGALIVANHGGVLPFDMIMVQAGLFYEHRSHRNL